MDKPDHNRFIQTLSEKPLGIQVYNSSQRNALKNFQKSNYTVLYFDATEKVFNHPFDYNHLKTYAINLYTILLDKMEVFKTCPPVGAFISERKRAMDIQHFLYDWYEYMGVKPQEVVMDQEAASLLAFLRVFNNIDLNSYIKEAFGYLSGLNSFKHVIIRLDKNHIAHTFSKIQLVNPNACSELIRRSILLLVEETDLNYIFAVFGNMCILLSNTHKNERVEKAEKFLNQHIRKENGINPSSVMHFNILADENWFGALMKIVQMYSDEEASGTSTSLNISIYNPYHDEKILKYITSISKKLLLWTAVIPHQKNSKKISGSSAAIESYHKHLKTDILLKQQVNLDKGITVYQGLCIDSINNRRDGNVFTILFFEN